MLLLHFLCYLKVTYATIKIKKVGKWVMNVKNEYKCKRCDNKDIIEFEGFSSLYIARCSVCCSQSILTREKVDEKANK